MGDVSDVTQDFAIEAWHEDGRWSVASLPDPNDLVHIIDRLKKQQTNGGSVALVAIDDEFFLAIRVLGSHIKYFISDVTANVCSYASGKSAISFAITSLSFR